MQNEKFGPYFSICDAYKFNQYSSNKSQMLLVWTVQFDLNQNSKYSKIIHPVLNANIFYLKSVAQS